MFNGTYVRYQSLQNRLPGGFAALLILPGILLIATALAILIWPELLAYLVALVLLFGGIALTFWGFSVRRATRNQRQGTVYYEVK